MRKDLSVMLVKKAFVAKVQLDKHSVIHKEVREKLIKCDLCEFCSDSRGNMKRHANSHFPAPKTLECNECAKLFGNKAHLERHRQIHNPSFKKKFGCERCNQSFSERYNLKQHIDFVHNKILKFVCKECGKKLKRLCDLTFHIEIDHPDTAVPNPEWKCIECDKFYPHSRALRLHTKFVHNTEPRHPCKPCGRVFKMKTKFICI